jgi:hypothetical protein
MNKFFDSLTFHISAFFAGFIFGSYIFGDEMVYFVGNIIVDAFFHALPITPMSASIMSNYTTGILGLTVVGLIQGSVFGIFFVESFSYGYIIGDLVLIALIGPFLWTLAQPVVIGMLIAIIPVIIGMYIRSWLWRPKKKYPRYSD